MKSIKLAVLLMAFGLSAGSAFTAEEGGKEKVTFKVGCFDVGASALQGQPGIISVKKDWQGGSEVNRVSYDPKQITIESMELKLKKAGTYRGTDRP